MKRITFYIKKFWLSYTLAIGCLFIAIALDMFAPQITRVIVNEVFVGNDFTDYFFVAHDKMKKYLMSKNIPESKINVKVSDEELEVRRKSYVKPEPNIKSGWLARYSTLVSSAKDGAVMKKVF